MAAEHTVLSRRVYRLEKRVSNLEDSPKDFWDKFSVWVPIIAAGIVALAGTVLAEHFRRSFEAESESRAAAEADRKLALAATDAMKDVLKIAMKVDDYEPLDQATRSLLGFGRHAVLPLVVMLQDDESHRRDSASEALKLFVLHSEEDIEFACSALARAKNAAVRKQIANEYGETVSEIATALGCEK